MVRMDPDSPPNPKDSNSFTLLRSGNSVLFQRNEFCGTTQKKLHPCITWDFESSKIGLVGRNSGAAYLSLLLLPLAKHKNIPKRCVFSCLAVLILIIKWNKIEIKKWHLWNYPPFIETQISKNFILPPVISTTWGYLIKLFEASVISFLSEFQTYQHRLMAHFACHFRSA